MISYTEDELDKINKEYEEKMKITTKELLKKYENADKICLTKYLGTQNKSTITQEELDKANEKFINNEIRKMYEIYDTDTKQSFEELYNEIYESLEKGKSNKYEDFSIYEAIKWIYNNNHNALQNNKIKPLDYVPEKIKSSLINYEYSYYNEVNMSESMMINYYFKFDNNIKEYLLMYDTDFDLKDLEDISLYKNNKVLFCSCTHERYNSLGD